MWDKMKEEKYRGDKLKEKERGGGRQLQPLKSKITITGDGKIHRRKISHLKKIELFRHYEYL